MVPDRLRPVAAARRPRFSRSRVVSTASPLLRDAGPWLHSRRHPPSRAFSVQLQAAFIPMALAGPLCDLGKPLFLLSSTLVSRNFCAMLPQCCGKDELMKVRARTSCTLGRAAPWGNPGWTLDESLQPAAERDGIVLARCLALVLATRTRVRSLMPLETQVIIAIAPACG